MSVNSGISISINAVRNRSMWIAIQIAMIIHSLLESIATYLHIRVHHAMIIFDTRNNLQWIYLFYLFFVRERTKDESEIYCFLICVVCRLPLQSFLYKQPEETVYPISIDLFKCHRNVLCLCVQVWNAIEDAPKTHYHEHCKTKPNKAPNSASKTKKQQQQHSKQQFVLTQLLYLFICFRYILRWFRSRFTGSLCQCKRYHFNFNTRVWVRASFEHVVSFGSTYKAQNILCVPQRFSHAHKQIEMKSKYVSCSIHNYLPKRIERWICYGDSQANCRLLSFDAG